ncbi:MAG TPA: hypothetical protein VGM90_40340 [Kofleriaceae bacterium]|jgi:hypothetical protein
MSRLRTLVTVALPSMLAGGLIFNAAFSRAASPSDSPGWASSATLVAQADPPKAPKAPTRPVPPAPPAPPARMGGVPPLPPVPPPDGGISVTIHDGKVSVTGVADMARTQLKTARDSIAKSNMPEDMKKKVLARLDKAQASMDKRLANIKNATPEEIEEQMETMGEEIAASMDGLDDEMEEMGQKMAEDAQKNMNFQFKFTHDDDDDDMPSAPTLDSDDDDLRDAIGDLKDLAVTPQQRDQIVKLRADSDKTVATSKKQIDDLSEKLHTALGDKKTTDADITRMVDQISAEEAKVRKARIIAWAQARRVLDAAQQKKVDDAAKKSAKKTK